MQGGGLRGMVAAGFRGHSYFVFLRGYVKARVESPVYKPVLLVFGSISKRVGNAARILFVSDNATYQLLCSNRAKIRTKFFKYDSENIRLGDLRSPCFLYISCFNP